ncbi:MAG: hypothetical protein HYV47_03270 [Candidatus Nealsonbacteria bacterium]|nr:hypothetical protein [Candidatus Nealsonbacteria bacterium]
MTIKKISDIASSHRPAAKKDNLGVRMPLSITSPIKKFSPLFTVASLLLAAVLSYFLIPPKVSIEIWPAKENMSEALTITVSSVPQGKNSILGEILEIEKTFSQNFSVQGTAVKEVKAKGVIRVYNNYSTAPQPLLATTRFISNDGKLFRTPQRVVIPGGQYEGAKLTPGSIDIEVVADQAGEEYNINPSTFSIPGFAGTPKYTAFYAKSFEQMAGGMRKEVPRVSQKEIDKAKEILSQKALAETLAVIKESLPSNDYSIIDKAISGEIVNFQSSAKANDESINFSAQVKLMTKALVFKNSDLKNFALNYLTEKITLGQKLIESSFKIDYSPETIDLKNNKLVLKLAIFSQSHSLPEENEIKNMIKGKSLKDIETILNEFNSIKNAKVEFWPFWVNLAPQDLRSIKVVLHLD